MASARRWANMRLDPMNALKRRKGIVWVQPYGVHFPMRAGKTDVVCVQTLAGFNKILGRGNLTQEELRTVFRDNREDFEKLASLLYESRQGDTIVMTTTLSRDAAHAERCD